MVSRLSDSEMKQAFEIYNKDMLSSDKNIRLNNIPCSLCGNVAKHGNYHCVYYGDLYTDDGHYMETKIHIRYHC